MKLRQHSARDYATAMRHILPPGAAWECPVDGFGDGLLTGTAQELIRVDTGAQQVLDAAIELHRPKLSSWHIDEYRRIAAEAIADEQALVPGVEILRIDHLIKPFCAGAHVGAKVWGHRARYILRVRYAAAHINPAGLAAALNAFKQAHVYLWMEAV